MSLTTYTHEPYNPEMKRFLTTYELETDRIRVFTEQDDYRAAIEAASDWVWQWATSHLMAISQHHDKVDEWEADPTKDTY